MLKAEELDLPFNRVYSIDGEIFVVSIQDKYTLAARDGAKLRCFYPEYFKWLVHTGHAKLLNTGSPTEEREN